MLKFWMAEDDRNKVISALSQIEARSAICRLRKERRMTSDEATVVLDAISAEMRRLIEQPVNPQVIEAANALVDRHTLRALDAVQLGSAVIARELLGRQEMRLVSSDQNLLEAAQVEGFATWNPIAGD